MQSGPSAPRKTKNDTDNADTNGNLHDSVTDYADKYGNITDTDSDDNHEELRNSYSEEYLRHLSRKESINATSKSKQSFNHFLYVARKKCIRFIF